METPLALFLSDVGRTLWAAGSRTTGAIEAQGVSSKFGPNDSRSFARGSMELALSVSCSQSSFVRDVTGKWEQTDQRMSKPGSSATDMRKRALKDSACRPQRAVLHVRVLPALPGG